MFDLVLVWFSFFPSFLSYMPQFSSCPWKKKTQHPLNFFSFQIQSLFYLFYLEKSLQVRKFFIITNSGSKKNNNNNSGGNGSGNNNYNYNYNSNNNSSNDETNNNGNNSDNNYSDGSSFLW